MAVLGVQAQLPAAPPQPAAQQTVAQQAIPDAPKPQPTLPNLKSVAPGQGTSSGSGGDSSSAPAPSANTPPAPVPTTTTMPPAPGESSLPTADDKGPVYQPAAGQGADAVKTLRVRVNYVDTDFTVKDGKGRLVPGLQPRDIQVYENGLLQHISFFTSDALPLSVALVIDQSMSQDEMDRVNAALGALPDAFTKYDDIAVFTYNKSTKIATDFTGAQSARLTQAIERSKSGGREAMMAGSLSGPLAQTTVVNDQNFDPNTAAQRGHTAMALDAPREVHPLNDAILAAATALSTRPIERRRVIYVISDGKEYGSQAKTAQVIKYLLANRIEVDATLVGESAIWGIGMLDRIHLPLMMRDNNLPPYVNATGGNIDAEFRQNAIEKSFDKIAGEARYRYNIGYYSHEPFVDGKYRQLEVRVVGHGNDLTILAKKGYWPSAMEVRPRTAVPISAP